MPRRRRSPRQAPQAQHAQTPGAEQAQQASNADTDQRWPRAQPVPPVEPRRSRISEGSPFDTARPPTPPAAPSEEAEAFAFARQLEVEEGLNFRLAQPPVESDDDEDALTVASSSSSESSFLSPQKWVLRERLYPLVQRVQPVLAGMITGILLKMSTPQIYELLESPDELERKVAEAVETWEAQQDAFRREAVALYRGQLVPMFLAAVRCEEYLDRFREAGIDDSALLCLTPADLRTLVGDADTAMRIVESDLLTDFLSALSDREAAGNRAAQMALQVQQLESHADQADQACGNARGVMEELEAHLTAARRDWSVKAEASEEAQAQLAEARNERAEAGELVVVADGEVTRAAARTEAALLEARLAALRPFEAAEPPLPAPPPADPGAANECPICLDRERDTAFIPCGHRACATCAGQMSSSRCPVCREPFSGTLRVY